MRSRWLPAVVLLGAVLRFFPIWFGLPFREARPDEETAIAHAVAILGGDLNPHFFHWPSLTFYLFAGCFAVASWIHRLLALNPMLTVDEQYLIARAVVAIAGTLTLVVLFSLARRVAGETVGLAASFFLAVAILHVRDSHFAMTDVLMTLLVTASLALLVRALDRATLFWFAAAGLAGGLATSTKYSAAAIVAALAAAQGILAWHSTNAWRWHVWMPSVAFLGAFALGFIVATPYALLDYPSFAAGLTFISTQLSQGHAGNFGIGWVYHLTRSLPSGLGAPLFVAAILGIVPMARDHRPAALVLLAFCAAFYAAVGNGHTVFFRYVLPLVPMACLSAAVAVSHTAEWLARRTALSSRVIIGVLTACIGAPSLVNSIWFDVLLAKTDTRVLAGRWLAAHVKPEESLYDAGRTYAEADLGGVRVHVWLQMTNGFDPAENAFMNAGGRTPDWLVFPQSPLEVYTAVPDGLQRLAAKEYVLAHIIRATRGREDSAVYDPEDAFFMPVSGFSTVLRPGPTLLIYRRKGG